MNYFEFTQEIKDLTIRELRHKFEIPRHDNNYHLYVATNSYRNKNNEYRSSIKIGVAKIPKKRVNEMGMKLIGHIKPVCYNNINYCKFESTYHDELDKMLSRNYKAYLGSGNSEMFGKFSDPEEADDVAREILIDMHNILDSIYYDIN